MICAGEIYDYIDSFAPFCTQMSFDNAGLLIGSREEKSEKVLLALDASKSVIEEAVRIGAKIIVTHHPVIFHAIKSVSSNDEVYLAAKNGLTILSAHTNLDIAEGGVNDSLAKAVGVTADERFDEDCALLGHLEQGTDSDGLAQNIQKRMKLNGLRYTDVNNEIKTVLVSCGAGGSNIYLANLLKADALITGEIKHHEIIYANERHISVFDLGHFQSENIIIDRLADLLSERFKDTQFIKSKTFTDRTKYIGV